MNSFQVSKRRNVEISMTYYSSVGFWPCLCSIITASNNWHNVCVGGKWPISMHQENTFKMTGGCEGKRKKYSVWWSIVQPFSHYANWAWNVCSFEYMSLFLNVWVVYWYEPKMLWEERNRKRERKRERNQVIIWTGKQFFSLYKEQREQDFF